MFLAPTPAMSIVEFVPELADGGLAEGYEVPRGVTLRSRMSKGERTPCRFRTAHPLNLLPLKIQDAGYFSRDYALLEMPREMNANAAIRINLSVTADLTPSQLSMDSIDFME